MCGRFVSASAPDELAQYFGAAFDDVQLESSFNVAPTNEVYVVKASDGHRVLGAQRWGLIPSWAKDIKIGSKMINARSETAANKPAFRKAFARRRCLVPADGFYEWAKVEGQKTKQPYFIHRFDGEPLVFAAMWERWRPRLEDGETIDPDASPVESCTILTCAANATLAPIHDRMPVLIPPSAWDDWLRPETDIDLISSLLVPGPENMLALDPVSTAVNRVANNSEELLRPIPVDAVPAGLPGSAAR